MEKLQDSEIDILIESVECWVNKDSTGELMTVMLDAVLGDKLSPEAKLKKDKEMAQMAEKRKIEKKLREETAIFLKAKLL